MPKWSDQGLLRPPGSATTGIKPAVTSHRAQLYCMFLGLDKRMYWTRQTDSAWSTAVSFGQTDAVGFPSLAVFDGNLYATVNLTIQSGLHEPNELLLYRFKDNINVWDTLTSTTKLKSAGPASLIERNGLLCCVYVTVDQQNSIRVATWKKEDGDTGRWTVQGTTNHLTYGESSVFSLQERLHVLYVTRNSSKRVREFRFDQDWNAIDVNGPQEESQYGSSASSIDRFGANGRAWMALQYNVGDGSFGVCSFLNASWGVNQSTGWKSMNTPALTLFKDTLVLIWNDVQSGDLRWATAPAFAD